MYFTYRPVSVFKHIIMLPTSCTRGLVLQISTALLSQFYPLWTGLKSAWEEDLGEEIDMMKWNKFWFTKPFYSVPASVRENTMKLF